MSVAQLSTAGLNKLFLEYIKPGLEVALYENSSVYDRFKTNTEDLLGKYGITKVLTSAPKSFRPSSSTTFPTAKQGYYREFTYYVKRGAYGSLQIRRPGNSLREGDRSGQGAGQGGDRRPDDVYPLETQQAVLGGWFRASGHYRRSGHGVHYGYCRRRHDQLGPVRHRLQRVYEPLSVSFRRHVR